MSSAALGKPSAVTAISKASLLNHVTPFASCTPITRWKRSSAISSEGLMGLLPTSVSARGQIEPQGDQVRVGQDAIHVPLVYPAAARELGSRCRQEFVDRARRAVRRRPTGAALPTINAASRTASAASSVRSATWSGASSRSRSTARRSAPRGHRACPRRAASAHPGRPARASRGRPASRRRGARDTTPCPPAPLVDRRYSRPDRPSWSSTNSLSPSVRPSDSRSELAGHHRGPNPAARLGEPVVVDDQSARRRAMLE